MYQGLWDGMNYNYDTVGEYTITLAVFTTNDDKELDRITMKVNVVEPQLEPDTTGPNINIMTQNNFDPNSETGKMIVQTIKTDKTYTIKFINDTSQDIIKIYENVSMLNQDEVINIKKGESNIERSNENEFILIPGDYNINILKENFYDDNNNYLTNDINLGFKVNMTTPEMEDLDEIDNSKKSIIINLSDKITLLPFEYSDITINTNSTSEYIKNISKI